VNRTKTRKNSNASTFSRVEELLWDLLFYRLVSKRSIWRTRWKEIKYCSGRRRTRFNWIISSFDSSQTQALYFRSVESIQREDDYNNDLERLNNLLESNQKEYCEVFCGQKFEAGKNRFNLSRDLLEKLVYGKELSLSGNFLQRIVGYLRFLMNLYLPILRYPHIMPLNQHRSIQHIYLIYPNICTASQWFFSCVLQASTEWRRYATVGRLFTWR